MTERALRPLRIAFLLSGAAALLFETLWFRQAGLLLGNALWASTIVLAAFMAGLALGNALAGVLAARVRRPVRVYQALELLVGAAGLTLVLAFPHLTPGLLPLLRAAAEWPAGLAALRLGVAFLLMLIPATAMGATLPLLVRACWSGRVGPALGGLYGWNTLGAVIGTLAGELLLIGRFGLRGTGLIAASLNLLAAAVAGASRGAGAEGAPVPSTWHSRSGRSWALLLAGFLSGAALLALEVLWFRFLMLHVVGTSLSFAVMLAVVLLGIAGGSAAAGRYTARAAGAPNALASIALASGICVMLGYILERDVLEWGGHALVTSPLRLALLATPLMLPTCLSSGAIFTLLGAALEERGAGPAQAASGVTLANTLGALCGALAGGLALLPGLGLERAFFAVAVLYGVVALCCATSLPSGASRARRLWPALAAAAYLALLALFPFGLMRNHYLPLMISRAVPPHTPGAEVLATREGINETIAYVRQSLWGTPVRYRLLTNALSMSSLDTSFTRYMRAFVYLPVAIHPEARSALLISYGIGVTARTLADTRGLTSIDVVDISPDILALGHLAFPPPAAPPLEDPRVRVHVEDGRFFLLTGNERYDIITAEPPPPNHAGIGNLYSLEYFRLLRERLADGGVASYWLPAYQLAPRDAKAITRAFCAAFSDCSLWSGFGPEFVLLGTRGTRPVGEEDFARQWHDPRVLASLRDVALERPEELGTLFVADAPALAEWTGDVAPVDDDHPYRISPAWQPLDSRAYLEFASPELAAARFAQSGFIRSVWPAALRERTLDAFAELAPVLRATWVAYGAHTPVVADLHGALTRSRHRTGVLWLLGSDAAHERAARDAERRGVDEPLLDELLAASAFADRDYLRAEALLARVLPRSRAPAAILQRRALALCLAGDHGRAEVLVRSARGTLPAPADEATWLRDECRLAGAAP